MKKRAGILLAAGMVLALAGCGAAEGSSAVTEPVSAERTVVEEAVEAAPAEATEESTVSENTAESVETVIEETAAEAAEEESSQETTEEESTATVSGQEVQPIEGIDPIQTVVQPQPQPQEVQQTETVQPVTDGKEVADNGNDSGCIGDDGLVW